MIAATMHGPNYFAVNHDEDSIEVFPHIGAVVETLFTRYSSNGAFACDVTTLNGETSTDLFPVFGEGMYFQCYEVGEYANFPALTEDNVMDVLTAVHSGEFDWFVALTEMDGQLGVKVINAAIQ